MKIENKRTSELNEKIRKGERVQLAVLDKDYISGGEADEKTNIGSIIVPKH